MSSQYRPEIDGLRAVAVLAVIVYHLRITVGGNEVLSGGFLGVDVFFVISGYLISRILLTEQAEHGRFSLRNFYWRRAKRILPPLCLVVIVTLAAGWIISLPTDLILLAHSAIASLFFLSNFYWYETLGAYGAPDGLLQPLLHTWSLAIEEQFYLVFPLILILVRRQAHLTLILLTLLSVSFATAELTTDADPQFSFFSPASRAWEMLGGALLALVEARRGLFANPLGVWIGVALILASFVFSDLDDMSHPGLGTLPVAVGTLLIIACAGRNGLATQALSSRPMVAVGKLSYSLYLWHFPVFAFGRTLRIEIGPLDYALWLVLTFSLSIVGYALVERPFRRRLGASWVLVGIGTPAAVTLAFAVFVNSQDGAPYRPLPLYANYTLNQPDNGRLRDESWSLLEGLAADHGLERAYFETERSWFTDPNKTNVLLIGNSHSKDVFNAFTLNPPLFPDLAFARFGLEPGFLDHEINKLFASQNFLDADVVLIAHRYREEWLDRLPPLIDILQSEGKRVVLAGLPPEYQTKGTVPVADFWIRNGFAENDIPTLNRAAFQRQTGRTDIVNPMLEEIALIAGVPYLDRWSLVCDESGEVCTVFTPERRKANYDADHWTVEGARLFGARAAQAGWGSILASERTGQGS